MNKSMSTISIIVNLVLMALGLVFIIMPDKTGIETIILILGIALMAIAAFMTIGYFVNKDSGFNVKFIIIFFAGGLLLVLLRYIMAYILIPIVIAAWALYSGVTSITMGMSLKKIDYSSWWCPFVMGIVYVILGIIVVTNMALTKQVVTMALGVWLIIFSGLGLINTAVNNTFSKKL